MNHIIDFLLIQLDLSPSKHPTIDKADEFIAAANGKLLFGREMIMAYV
jgi:hypothetical protein